MRNLKITLEYDGANYCGWQAQKARHRTPGAGRVCKKSVQECLEKILFRVLREKTHLIGSGRTDSGVHALAQVANFHTRSQMPLDKLQRALNGLLPGDIRVTRAEEADEEFHSRYYAKSKVYRYLVLNQPSSSALLRKRVYFYPYKLDLTLMRREARSILGRHDFKAFCASGSSARTTARVIRRISIKRIAYRPEYAPYSCTNLISFEIEADGFLYNMARNIVGTLLEIGRGKMPAGSMRRLLLLRDRRKAGPIVPAYGLYLVKVNY